MESITSFFLVFIVLAAVFQLFWGYALSTIASKGGQSDLMQMLAWIPFLQTAPLVVAGGGSIQGFVFGTIGLILGAVVLGLLSSLLGGMLGGLGMIFILIFAVGYFARLSWNMAVHRDVSGWIGLLIFVPGVNFFVYPYIAFHDGWETPNKAGLAIALVLALGSAGSSIRSLEALGQEGGPMSEWSAVVAESTELRDLLRITPPGSESSDSTSGSSMKNIEGAQIDPVLSIRALYSMQDRFDRLQTQIQSSEIGDPEASGIAMGLLIALKAELKAQRHVIDGRTYQQLATDLEMAEARVQADSNHQSPSREHGVWRAKPNVAVSENTQQPQPGPASFHSNPSPRSSTSPLQPFAVHAADGCPDGTNLRTRAKDAGEEEWCEQLPELGGLRHGWYARYLDSGRPESMGEYSNGLRVGVWTRFYPSGEVRAQAEFVEGLQHGWLLSFDETGKRTRAVRFDEGVRLP